MPSLRRPSALRTISGHATLRSIAVLENLQQNVVKRPLNVLHRLRPWTSNARCSSNSPSFPRNMSTILESRGEDFGVKVHPHKPDISERSPYLSKFNRSPRDGLLRISAKLLGKNRRSTLHTIDDIEVVHFSKGSRLSYIFFEHDFA